jgi:hypothetical protein
MVALGSKNDDPPNNLDRIAGKLVLLRTAIFVLSVQCTVATKEQERCGCWECFLGARRSSHTPVFGSF